MPDEVEAFYGEMYSADRPIQIEVLLRIPRWGEAGVTLLNTNLGEVVEAAEGLGAVASHWRDLVESCSFGLDSEDEGNGDEMDMDVEEEDGEDGMDIEEEEAEDPRACTCVFELGGNDCDQHWDWKDFLGSELAKLCVNRPTVDGEDIWGSDMIRTWSDCGSER
ncbi:uncharacterized protein MYCFIDRAFT_198753 [Pseudocercospora fijiensis CIRAD86]|uniref:Uncharacterized protein n=1 Tax=Pseudocercospora fijiensis (strain CIRAD86) TaxID=383855 RepID=M2ZN86_PSEFD|nr:uncharacterized protein MYCFIDRAFT_198753 [Pseudocercospora fijiensis CIRAD86]EME80564.1 hypothetical protein MYCFIDRAFT_198753 [Pseudocercospora fijiensis CIRAD86]